MLPERLMEVYQAVQSLVTTRVRNPLVHIHLHELAKARDRFPSPN